jgi:hypothetical protein
MPLKPTEILAAVKSHETATDTLRQRWRDDYDLYRLVEYAGEEGYQKYTSNEPQTLADKIISWLVDAELVIRINNVDPIRQERDVNNAKERFFIGSLRQADERLVLKLMPPLRDQLAWYVTLRGWYAVRTLLIKEEDGASRVDIMPWDPLYTFWGLGSDGLDWVAHKTLKTPLQIKTAYGVDIIPKNNKDNEGIEVFDFYDEEINTVITDGKVLKKPTPHGCECVPVAMGVVGTAPPVHIEEDQDVSQKYYGESIYKANRDGYDTNNFIMSVMKELVARAKKQGIKVRSSDGTKTLDEDPFKSGSEVSLSREEDIEPMGLMEMARETGAFLGLLGGEIQRGGIPHSVYGELQFQLSGFAINTLRQGINTQLQPRLSALENAYKQIINLLNDQYISGAYDAITLSGRDSSKNYFNEEITPDVIREGGDPEITLVARLPQDDPAMFNMAQMAREGAVPLLPDIYIRDQVLGLQNADLIDDSIKEQLGERVLPEAGLYTLMSALENRGRSDLAQLYYGELLKLMQKSMVEGGIPVGSPTGPRGPGGPRGPNGANGATLSAPAPSVVPPAMLGVPPPVPNQQAGPLVPPGTPRPGGLTDVDRLTRLGLVGPSG